MKGCPREWAHVWCIPHENSLFRPIPPREESQKGPHRQCVMFHKEAVLEFNRHIHLFQKAEHSLGIKIFLCKATVSTSLALNKMKISTKSKFVSFYNVNNCFLIYSFYEIRISFLQSLAQSSLRLAILFSLSFHLFVCTKYYLLVVSYYYIFVIYF